MLAKRAFLISSLLATVAWMGSVAAGAEQTRALIVVGPSNHPPGSHEPAAGARLMKYCLESMKNCKPIQADVISRWPEVGSTLERYSTVVLIGDQFPGERLDDSERVMKDLAGMMARGCGMVCIHYGTGITNGDVGRHGDHPLLHWTGGYFATRCDHHQSVARIYPTAKIEPADAGHPIARGWKPFELRDEPYINNYFGPDANRMLRGAFAVATSMLPPEKPKRETIAWGIDRQDGGRGFGVTLPHFYQNWQLEPLRMFILNGIVWTAQQQVPPHGVQTTLPDLATFHPASVEFRPRTGPTSRRDAKSPANVRVIRNVAFADNNNPRQQLDLVLPRKPAVAGRLPVVVLIHGGGFRTGNRAGYLTRAKQYAATGRYAAATVGYRLSGEAIWPAQIHDCKAAVRWLKAHADQYRLDVNRFAAGGGSAGGHLAAMLGVSAEVDAMEGRLGSHLDQDSRVACVVERYGPTELLSMNDAPGNMDHNAPDSPESELIGGPIQQNQQKARSASPTSYVTADDAAFHILHGEEDMAVPCDQSERLHGLLQATGVPSTLVIIPAAGHGLQGVGGLLQRELDFLDRQFWPDRIDPQSP